MKKEELFKVLDFWNYWNSDVKNFNQRNFYLKKIEILKKADENIILKWIRRSGKSTILNLEIKKLLNLWINRKNILFINFEEPKFFWKLNLDLLDEIWETYIYFLEPNIKEKIYIFLDEVQNVEAWEKWVLKFYEKKDVQFFITGSSSKLLSREFSTALAWRYLSLNILPLWFCEFLDFKKIKYKDKKDLILNKNPIKKWFDNYLKFWWFPKITLLNNDEQLIKEELNSYFDTIIIKDIAKRYKIINIEDLKKLAYYFLSNDTKLFSVNKLKNLNLWAYETIKKYIEYFKETYLFFELKKFSYSLKSQMISQKKIYSIDLWFVNLLSFQFSENIWRKLENIVFIELKRRWKEVFYHKEKYECDFIIKEKNKIVEVIQVANDLISPETEKREINWLIDAMKHYSLSDWIILTYETEKEIEIKNKNWDFKIKIIPIWKWLLR